jgi:vitamin B12 transporter
MIVVAGDLYQMFLSDLPPPPSQPATEILVTAARRPEPLQSAPVTATIIDAERMRRLGDPQIVTLLRQVPSAAVSLNGPAGSLAEVRIRGAEANHTLLFVDGIRANDPAAGNTPRFELLNADLFSRIEVVRGPQSALWGSEAIGGVVAVDGAGGGSGASATAEAGSFGFRRIAGRFGRTLGKVTIDLAAGDQRATGIDAFAGGPMNGERDGFRNRSGLGRVVVAALPGVQLGASGFALTGRSDFDGYDPMTFERGETLDNSRNRLAAGRLWGEIERDGWTGSVSASRLASRNRNLLARSTINLTRASRDTLSAQVERKLSAGAGEHRLLVAGEVSGETFRSDNPSDNFADQRRQRNQTAVTGEWRATWSNAFSTDVAVRRDVFSGFADATTLRAAALLTAAPGVQLSLSYGEGIAQPTFFDLYGYYPGSFVGNPALTPERSRGVEASIRLARGPFRASLAAYRQRLQEEIISRFDFTTFQSSTANAVGASLRQGLEAELSWAPSPALRVTTSYAFLDAKERPDPAFPSARELRRPRHSGSVAVDGEKANFVYGGALTYAGAHDDRRDSFPYDVVSLRHYWLASARLGYRLSSGVELFGRLSNALGARAQDVAGYATEGRSIHAGLRLRFGD